MGLFTVPNTKPTAHEHAGRVRADLASNPQFAAWARGGAETVASPLKFGINYLPKGAWIDKQGNVVTTDTGIPTAAKLLPIAGMTLGAMTLPGLPLAAATGSSSTAAGLAPLAPTIPGSAASTAYGAGMFAAPSATAATLATTAPAAATSAGALLPGSVAAGTHMGLTVGDLIKIGQGGGDALLGLYGSHKQGQAASEAARLQAQGLAAQLAFEREQETRRRQEYDQQQATLKAQWDADQAWRAPYRQASASILARYTGQPAPASYAPQPLPPGYAGTPTLHPLTTIGAIAGSPPASPIPPTAPLAAPQAIYNPNARTIGDLIAPRY